MATQEETQNGSVTIFHLFGILLALGVVAGAIKTGWDTGGAAGVIAGVVISLIIAPVMLIVGFAGSVVALGLLAFVGSHEPPPGLWMGRVHKAARGLVIVACVVSIVHFVPHLFATPNWRTWNDEDKLGVFFPICMILFLYISKLEMRATRGPEES